MFFNRIFVYWKVRRFLMKRFINDIKKFFNYTVFSAKADLKSEVADSFLSWLWWILDPLLYMLVYSFIAIVVFKSGEPYFPVFVFIGMNCWTFFSKTVKSAVKLVKDKKMIVTKVYIPKYMFIFEKIGVYGFKMLVSFILTALLMVIYQVPLSWRMFYAIPLMIILLIGTFAASTIITHFGVFVDDLSNVITVVLQLMFYMSGIFYSIENRVPAPFSEWLLKLNPVALIITDLRRVLLENSDPHFFSLLAWLGISIIVAIIGVRTIYKQENSYVKVI